EWRRHNAQTWASICRAPTNGLASLQDLTGGSTVRRPTPRTFWSLTLQRVRPSVRTWVWICLALGLASLQDLMASSTAHRTAQRTFSSLILRRELPSVRTWARFCLALPSGQASL